MFNWLTKARSVEGASETDVQKEIEKHEFEQWKLKRAQEDEEKKRDDDLVQQAQTLVITQKAVAEGIARKVAKDRFEADSLGEIPNDDKKQAVFDFLTAIEDQEKMIQLVLVARGMQKAMFTIGRGFKMKKSGRNQRLLSKSLPYKSHFKTLASRRLP